MAEIFINIPGDTGGGGGSVDSVSGASPISSSGGTNPIISISQAGTTTNGYLSSTDFNTFNNKQNELTVGAIDGQAFVADGLQIISDVLYAQSANALYPGMVNNTAQTFSGSKTILGDLTVEADNGGGPATVNFTVNANGAFNNTASMNLVANGGGTWTMRIDGGDQDQWALLYQGVNYAYMTNAANFLLTGGNNAIVNNNRLNINGTASIGVSTYGVSPPGTADLICGQAVFGSGNSGIYQIESGGDIAITDNNSGLLIAEGGSSAKSGVATLIGGTVTVPNNQINSTTRIHLSYETFGGTPGSLSAPVSARTGSDFTILSSSNTDTSDVIYLLIDQP